MLAKVYSSAVIGLEGVLVEVEVDIAQGLPAFTIVGLAIPPCRRVANGCVQQCATADIHFP
jgi:predicted ATPase with chaperone activity